MDGRFVELCARPETAIAFVVDVAAPKPFLAKLPGRSGSSALRESRVSRSRFSGSASHQLLLFE